MATLLYRLGHFSFRRAWLVIGAWFLILAGILGGALALGGQTQESFTIPGTESQDTLDHLAAVFPEVAGGSVQVVYQAPGNASVRSDDLKAAIEKGASELGKVDGVDTVLSPFSPYASDAISANDRAAITTVQLEMESSEVPEATLDAIRAAAEPAEAVGLRVEFGGLAFQDTTFGITITEALGVIFAGVVLVITFGSLIAAGMPLLSALVGVGISMGLVLGASAFMTVSSASPLLALMLGLAVGIDYALFILSRHRNQLAQGVDPEESAASSVATAGSAVVFAGITVIIALLGLLVVGIPFLSVMGVAAAVAVFIAVLVAITLIPALLGLAGRRLIPNEGSRAHRRAQNGTGARPSFGLRWVRLVLKAPTVAVVAVVLILGTLAIPMLSLDLNLPSGASEPQGSTARDAYDIVSEDFGAGHNGPLVVVVDITQTLDIEEDLQQVSDRLNTLDDVAFVSQGLPNPSLDSGIIQVIPESAPESTETKELVATIRDLGPTIEAEWGTPIAVTGATAVAVDISNRLSQAMIPFTLVVVGLSILLLMMVFRSVIVPLKAAAGFLLSIGAATGVVVAIFQWGWLGDLLNIGSPGPILSFLPILMTALLFGLAMDYEVFLVSGMREEFVKTGNARQAIEHGFSNAARVVTAAALIMFFVFFAFVPEGSGVIKGIALGLAVGVFFDAFLVRMTFGPAVMALVGRAAWWLPAWLSALLPNVDIEGEGLRQHLDDRAWARGTIGAISADGLVAGVPECEIGPYTIDAETGGILFLTGNSADRRVLAATLAGRLDPVAGRVQVLGHPLPSDHRWVTRSVALADVVSSGPAGDPRTVGDVLGERLELHLPWYRWMPRRFDIAGWIDRINRALGQEASPIWISDRTVLTGLPAAARATCLAAAALAERPGAVILDLGDGLPNGANEQFLRAVSSVAPAGTNIIVSSTESVTENLLPDQLDGRGVVEFDVSTTSAKEVLQ